MSIERQIHLIDDDICAGDGDSIEARLTVRSEDYECPYELTVNCQTIWVSDRGLRQLIRLATVARKEFRS